MRDFLWEFEFLLDVEFTGWDWAIDTHLCLCEFAEIHFLVEDCDPTGFGFDGDFCAFGYGLLESALDSENVLATNYWLAFWNFFLKWGGIKGWFLPDRWVMAQGERVDVEDISCGTASLVGEWLDFDIGALDLALLDLSREGDGTSHGGEEESRRELHDERLWVRAKVFLSEVKVKMMIEIGSWEWRVLSLYIRYKVYQL